MQLQKSIRNGCQNVTRAHLNPESGLKAAAATDSERP